MPPDPTGALVVAKLTAAEATALYDLASWAICRALGEQVDPAPDIPHLRTASQALIAGGAEGNRYV